ncbi:MAG: sporulation protein YqfD [Clostridia bacterium]|nr:sporulation protein YqfD [Clostridia bacterium]
MRFFDYVRGLYKIYADEGAARRVLSAMVAAKIPFGAVGRESGKAVFFARKKDVDKIDAIAKRVGADIVAERTGFPAFIKRYRKRLGLAVGAVLALFLVAFSSRFVWDIKITGNSTVPTGEIIAALDAYGFRLGTYIPSADVIGIGRKIAIENENITWMSINIRGTVARVEVRETTAPSKESLAEPSNLVASSDGQIVRVEAYGGKSEVKAGQTVKKGDLLVSGVVDSAALGYRLVRARGSVYASVTKTFTASVDTSSHEKIYTGEEKAYKTVKIFSKTAELFKNIDISYEKYDTIEETERLSVFGADLPIFVKTVRYVEYIEKPLTLTDEEALKKAREAIAVQAAAELENDEILARYENVTYENGVCTLKVLVECVTDIASEQKIKTEQ